MVCSAVHPAKGETTLAIEAGMMNSLIAVQPLNAPLKISVMPAGSVTDSSAVHPSNNVPGMSSIVSGNTTLFNAVQFAKAPIPNELTFAGRVKIVKPVPLNAFPLIAVRLSGKVVFPSSPRTTPSAPRA